MASAGLTTVTYELRGSRAVGRPDELLVGLIEAARQRTDGAARVDLAAEFDLADAEDEADLARDGWTVEPASRRRFLLLDVASGVTCTRFRAERLDAGIAAVRAAFAFDSPPRVLDMRIDGSPAAQCTYTRDGALIAVRADAAVQESLRRVIEVAAKRHGGTLKVLREA